MRLTGPLNGHIPVLANRAQPRLTVPIHTPVPTRHKPRYLTKIELVLTFTVYDSKMYIFYSTAVPGYAGSLD